jgi:UDP-glucose:(heptosyl)LPS alpha-1,3-glucosyltransferase
MNIALIVHDLHEHGGHSLYTKTLADHLSSRHNVTVFANRCERPPASAWKFQRVAAWRRTALSSVATFPLGLKTRSKKLDQFAIRHAQGFCGGNPNVVTAHICVAAYLNSLRDSSARTRASLHLMAAAEKRFYRSYEGRVIAISQKVANELREFYDFRGSITVVHHGVDAHSMERVITSGVRAEMRKELDVRSDETVALYVGDLTKAHTRLKQLAALAPEIKFVIVTASTEYQWKAANVRIMPPTRNIARYYAAADTFVFPTTYDAFGMVVLEAMAAGLPVFTSDCAGAAELITNGKDGLVMPLDGWVDGAASALRDRSTFASVGATARETAQRHNWSDVIEKTEQVYFEVAAATEPAQLTKSFDEYRYQQS